MITVTMRLDSAIHSSRDVDLVTIEIINLGNGTPTRGNYEWHIRGKNNLRLLKTGQIHNWPRKAKPPIALLQRVINDAYPQ